MAQPEPTGIEGGTPLPPDDTESGRAKHVAPDDAVTADQLTDAESSDAQPTVAQPTVAQPTVVHPAVADPAGAEPAVVQPAVVQPAVAEPTVAQPTVAQPTVAQPTVVQPAAARPAATAVQPEPVVQPATAQPIAAAATPAPPKDHGNRFFASAVVLLASLIFEIIYIAAIAVYIIIVGGTAQLATAMASLFASPFAWAPVVLFFVLFELSALLLNRAGRFAFVFSSLIVGLLVYFVSILLVLLIEQGKVEFTVVQNAIAAPEFILAGLVAREVMLWTGIGIGARGKRLRDRNKADWDAYEHDLVEAA